jgi:hypothetical protein
MAAAWQAVSSRAIDAYRWNAGVLELRFRATGRIYEYACDEALLARFLAADSKGAFVNQVLKPLDQRARTRAQFARQAATFESPAYLFTDASILDWIAEHTPTRPTDRILDVAGGTGALARRLVRDARSAVVLDLVPEMLARAPRDPDVLYVLVTRPRSRARGSSSCSAKPASRTRRSSPQGSSRSTPTAGSHRPTATATQSRRR